MRYRTAEVPAYDVAGQIVLGVRGDGLYRAVPGDEGHQVGHAPVVNVAVRLGEAPLLGVFGEPGLHVLMYFLLQVDAQLAVGADHHVRTHAAVGGHITIRIAYAEVRGVIPDMLFGQRERGIRQAILEVGLPLGRKLKKQGKKGGNKRFAHGEGAVQKRDSCVARYAPSAPSGPGSVTIRPARAPW